MTVKKPEFITVRTTKQTKNQIQRLVDYHRFSSKADVINTGLNLMINDAGGLFANISRSMSEIENYTPQSEEQYQRFIEAYKGLQAAYGPLSSATDDVDRLTEKQAPNEYKDTLRDFLIPAVVGSLRRYEDAHHIPLEKRWTEPGF